MSERVNTGVGDELDGDLALDADEPAGQVSDGGQEEQDLVGVDDDETPPPRRLAVLAVLGLVAMVLAGGAGYLKYVDSTQRASDQAAIASVQAAKDATVAMLSYTPGTAEKDLTAANQRMIGTFRDSYGSLIHDVVIPGAQQQKVSAVASVPAAASVSSTSHHAVALVYVNQAITMGDGTPTQTNSVVEVTLDQKGGQWLISGFEPK